MILTPAVLHEASRLKAHSLALIVRSQSTNGAFVASPSYETYRFCWLRDGAFIAHAASLGGAAQSAEQFFDWCSDAVLQQSTRVRKLVEQSQAGHPVPVSDHPPARFALDGSDAADDWPRFQPDGYGAWMWALGEHVRRHDGVEVGRYRDAVRLCVEYLAEVWDRPSFDWWEEHPGSVHLETVAAIRAGLESAVHLGLLDEALTTVAVATVQRIDSFIETEALLGCLTKSHGGGPVDAALLACSVPFGAVPAGTETAEGTYGRIDTELSIAGGGVHRYLADTYYGGGQWVPLAGFIGWYEASTGRLDKASRRLEWMMAQAKPDGFLPEQTTVAVLHPAWTGHWVKQWGSVATPLLWSHAMLVILAHHLDV